MSRIATSGSASSYLVKRSLTGKQSVKYKCPGCGEPLESPLEEAGQKFPCPHCHREIETPGTAELVRRRAEAEAKIKPPRVIPTEDEDLERSRIQRQREEAERAAAKAAQPKPEPIDYRAAATPFPPQTPAYRGLSLVASLFGAVAIVAYGLAILSLVGFGIFCGQRDFPMAGSSIASFFVFAVGGILYHGVEHFLLAFRDIARNSWR